MRIQQFLVVMTMALCQTAESFMISPTHATPGHLLWSSTDDWLGDVVSGGKIRGCSLQQVDDSITDWIVTIDGEEADLGKFSEAIYKKLMTDAKQQRFQGFRPGTIPPHLEPTYRAFAMDECARETVLEAMEQNNLRPFTDCRSELLIENVSIPPPIKKGGKKKKKKTSRKKKGMANDDDAAAAEAVNQVEEEPEEPEVPVWLTYDNMKSAIDAGWRPGQSFSFIAKNVKGQKVLTDRDTKGATPLGLNY